jgi:hypothetical protein
MLKRFALFAAILTLSFPTLADEKTLSGAEILELVSGAVMYGYDLDPYRRMRVEVTRKGQVYVLYDYDSPQPFMIKGTWQVKGDLWCRILKPRRQPVSDKCQTVVEEGGVIYFVDEDGSRQSRFLKKDIRKR